MPTAAPTPGPVDSRGHHQPGSATFPLRGAWQPEVADSAARAPGARGIGAWLARRPWVATAVAISGIVVVLALQAFGGSGRPTPCDGPGCPAPTTRVAAADGGSSVGTPPTTVVESSTTSPTVAGGVVVAPSSSAPRTSAATVPPTTAAPTTTTVAPAPT